MVGEEKLDKVQTDLREGVLEAEGERDNTTKPPKTNLTNFG
jgi:hypothetical protein